jgi:asparagine synthase (glutamine-hydrolysing)
MMEKLQLAITLYDEPFGGGSWGPTYRVSELAREHVKVVLSGDGGDEIFAGYRWYGNWYQAWKWQKRLRWMPPIKQLHTRSTNRYILQRVGMRWPKTWPGRDLIHHLSATPVDSTDWFVFAPAREPFSPAEKRQLLAPEWSREFNDYDDYWYFRQYWHSDLDIITRLQYIDFKTLLCDSILTKVDRASMAVSLEVRPPLLDHVLVEQLFSIPTELRMQGGELKGLFKQAMQDLVPPEILTRPKKGFGAPWSTWMNNNVQWDQHVVQSKELAGFLRNDAEQTFAFNMWQKWFLLLLQQWFQHEHNNYPQP